MCFLPNAQFSQQLPLAPSMLWRHVKICIEDVDPLCMPFLEQLSAAGVWNTEFAELLPERSFRHHVVGQSCEGIFDDFGGD